MNLELLEQPWVRDLFLEFCASDLLPKEIGRITARIDSYAMIFWTIDRCCDRLETLNQITLFEMLGREGLRRSFNVVRFLCEHAGIEWSYSVLNDLTEVKRQRAILDGVRNEPWGAELSRYAQKLCAAGTTPLSARTKRGYLTAATGLMRTSGAPAFNEVLQRHVDKYLLGAPGQSASLQSFLKHLNDEHGLGLKGGKLKRSNAGILERKLITKLKMALDALNNDSSMSHRQAAFITLVSELSQTSSTSILSVRTDVSIQEVIMQLLSKKALTFDVDIILRVIEKFRIIKEEGELLFPGRNRVQPRSPDYLRYYSRRRHTPVLNRAGIVRA